jgi:hypothetical protein
MSDEDQMIAEARARDERAAQLLGDYTPTSRPLYRDDVRAVLWFDIIHFLEHVADAGPDHLADPARDLLERVHTL